MEIKTLSPAEIASVWVDNGVKKAANSALKTILLAIFAGMFIGFGGFANIVAVGSIATEAAPGFGKLFGAAIFPVGLMLVIYCGAELFTGNNLLVVACMDKKITVSKLLRNWALVYIGNVIGSYLLAWIIYVAGSATSYVGVITSIANAKTNPDLTFTALMFRGILCNILVVLACWFQAASKDLIGKIFAVWFPIMMFVFCGFEHSIANMFFLPLAQLHGAELSTSVIWIKNLLPVTLGNIIGGAGIVSMVYYYVYVYKPTEERLPPHKSARRKKK